MEFESDTQFNSLGKRLRNEDAAEISSTWDDQSKHRRLAFRPPNLGQSSTLFVAQQGNQQLPFAHAQPGPNTPTLTPADSSSDSSNAEIRSPPLGPSVAVPSTVFTPADDDTDMVIDEDGMNTQAETPSQSYDMNSPMVSPKSQTPSRSGSKESRQGRLAPIMLGAPNQSHDLSTRVPTPIYGHFSTHGGDAASSAPVNNNSSNSNNSAIGGVNGSPLPHHSRSNHYNIALYPHHNIQERKMPSPISEDFAHEVNGSGTQNLHVGHQQYLTQMQNLQVNHAGLNVDEDMAMSPASPTAPSNPIVMSRSPSIGQRRRSDAISGSPNDGPVAVVEMTNQNSNGGTLAPDLNGSLHSKASFHMGYKADCKMCQDKVPGHFNHITHTRA